VFHQEEDWGGSCCKDHDDGFLLIELQPRLSREKGKSLRRPAMSDEAPHPALASLLQVCSGFLIRTGNFNQYSDLGKAHFL
jgi:hypothetical protein